MDHRNAVLESDDSETVPAEASLVGVAPILGLVRAMDEFREVDPDPTVQVVQAFLAVAIWEGSVLHELAERLNVSPSTISRNMGLLGDYGRGRKKAMHLVHVHEDPQDRRFKVAKLTPRGRELAARMVAASRGR